MSNPGVDGRDDAAVDDLPYVDPAWCPLELECRQAKVRVGTKGDLRHLAGLIERVQERARPHEAYYGWRRSHRKGA